MLQGKHITFSYSDSAKGKIDVLKDVSFEIREHDFIGLIGTSGSGKTTLIKHLNGLLKAESGEIFFNGRNMIVVPCEARLVLYFSIRSSNYLAGRF